MYTLCRSSIVGTLLSRSIPVIVLAVVSVLLLLLPPSSTVQAGILDLAWDGPTSNADGTALTDLSAYRLYSAPSGSPCLGGSFQDIAPASPHGGGGVTSRLTGLVTGITYFVQVAAVDSSGNESDCSNVVSAAALAEGPDTTPPSGSIRINEGAGYTAWTAVTLSLAASDAVGVAGYFVSTSSSPPSSGIAGWVPVTSTTSYSDINVPYTLSSGDGTKRVYAWYKDAVGNVSGTTSASIQLDQTAPSGGALTGTPGSAQVALNWSGFSDGGSGLNTSTPYKLVFRTGGFPSASCMDGTRLLQGSATSFNHTGLTNGTTYYYRVCATDSVGNTSTGATATTTAATGDTTAPAVTITSPTSNPTYSTSNVSVNLAGTASDTVGVRSVAWANDRGGSGTATGTTSWTAGGITLQAGTNVLTVTARDAAGNSRSDTLTVTYTPPKTVSPIVTIIYPTSNSTYSTISNSLTLMGSASGNGGVRSVMWTSDRGGTGKATGTSTWVIPKIPLKSGTNVITVSALDSLGNVVTDSLTVTNGTSTKAGVSSSLK